MPSKDTPNIRNTHATGLHIAHEVPSLEDVVNMAFEGEVSWTHDQLDGTSSLDDALSQIENDKKQVLAQLQLIIEYVIGPDGRATSQPAGKRRDVSGIEHQVTVTNASERLLTRNELRAEQRQRLQQITKGISDGK